MCGASPPPAAEEICGSDLRHGVGTAKFLYVDTDTPTTPRKDVPMLDTPAPGRHTHTTSLSDIIGYDVRQTIVDGIVLGHDGPIVATFDRPEDYGKAVGVAQGLRSAGSWALVDSRYACGCTDADDPLR